MSIWKEIKRSRQKLMGYNFKNVENQYKRVGSWKRLMILTSCSQTSQIKENTYINKC